MRKAIRTRAFLRTLCVVLAFWLAMVTILSVNNLERRKSATAASHAEARRLLSLNIRSALQENAGAPEERESLREERERLRAVIRWYLTADAVYTGASMGVSRLYGEDGEEIARSQLSLGAIKPFDGGAFDYYLLFDPVLTEEEHLSMAERLRKNPGDYRTFYGTAKGDFSEQSAESGLYGEVTGIVDGISIYPKKLTYHYEEETVVLVESDHEMFADAELTTIKFDHSRIDSALLWGDLSPEKLLELFREAERWLDVLVEERVPSADWSSTWRYDDGEAQISSSYILPEHPLSYAYIFSPPRLAVHGLGATYVLTLLGALAAAAFLAWMQARSMRRERELTRAMTHAFKTPAAVVRAYAEALREDVAPARRTEYLDALMEETDRMGTMVSELLDLSRLHGASPATAREEVDLTALVERCFARLRLAMEERGLALSLSLETVTCIGDEKRLEQAVSNLALNALRHAAPGPVRVALTADGALTMENRCPPLPPQALARLWEPFYRANAGEDGGSGLGLAIVDNIVRVHGGRRAVEATEEGLRFCIRLVGTARRAGGKFAS